MSNQLTAITKIILLVGGAAAGALLARLADELLAKRLQERSGYDKARYGQGLTPVPEQPLARNVLTPEDLKKRNLFSPWKADITEDDEKNWPSSE